MSFFCAKSRKLIFTLTETTLICIRCDPEAGFDKGKHEHNHTLLKVKADDENEVDGSAKELESIEASLKHLEDRLGDLSKASAAEVLPRIVKLLQKVS